MQYPLISEYVRAIQDASSNLDKLAHLVPVLDDHGEPYRSSGAFAVVFKMKDEQTGKCYALKCFTEEQEGRAEAYRQIADELEFVDSSYITSVKYLEKEIFVDSSCEEDEFPVKENVLHCSPILPQCHARHILTKNKALSILPLHLSMIRRWWSQGIRKSNLKSSAVCGRFLLVCSA